MTDNHAQTPLRLLFVSHSFPPEGRPLANVGGMQRVATELSEALQASPDVALKRVILRSAWRWTGPLTVPFLFGLVGRLPRMARAHRADVIVFSSVVTALVCWPLRRRLQAQGVVTAAIVHGLDVTTPIAPYQWLVRRAFRALDLVLPVSRATAEACVARGLAPAKVRVIPNGVSVERFLHPSGDGLPGGTPPLYPFSAGGEHWGGGLGGDGVGGDGVGGDGRAEMEVEIEVAVAGGSPPPGPHIPAARKRLATRFAEPDLLAEGTVLLCSVGRHVPRKGFDWFVRHVMPQLPDHVHYWLAGEGPTTEAIQTAAEEAGVADRVRLLGCISEADLRALLRGADLLVMPNLPIPNDVEGFGIVMLEAGLCGTPSVAAALDGIRDVIAEGESGHLVTPGDVDAFAEVVLRYSADRLGLDALSRRALDHTKRTYNWSAVAARYVDVLRERVGHRRAVHARAHRAWLIPASCRPEPRPAHRPRPTPALVSPSR